MEITRPSAACRTPAGLENTMAAMDHAVHVEALQVTKQEWDFSNDFAVDFGDRDEVAGREQYPDQNEKEGDNNTAAVMTVGQVGSPDHAAAMSDVETMAPPHKYSRINPTRRKGVAPPCGKLHTLWEEGYRVSKTPKII